MSNPLSFSFDLSTVDLSRPLLSAGSYLMRIAETKTEESKAKPGNWNYVVVFETVVAATSAKAVEDGQGVEDDIGAGFKITKYYPLQQSDNPKAPPFLQDITRLWLAVYNAKTPADAPAFDNNADIAGKEVAVTVRVAKAAPGSQYGDSNEIQKIQAIQ